MDRDNFTRKDFERALDKVVPPAKSKRNPHAEQIAAVAKAVAEQDDLSVLEAVSVGFALGLSVGERLSNKTRKAFKRACLDIAPRDGVKGAAKAGRLPWG